MKEEGGRLTEDEGSNGLHLRVETLLTAYNTRVGGLSAATAATTAIFFFLSGSSCHFCGVQRVKGLYYTRVGGLSNQAFQFRKHDFDLWVGGDGLDMYQQLEGGFGSMRAILPI